tara:strand:- start:749 stop:949 length:201 start_codon:yes stop_codon:yes gene_type:complete
MPRRSSQTVEEGCPEFDRPGRTVAVLGAGGFFGQRLVFALLQTNVGMNTETFSRPFNSHPILNGLG